ncbi:MAG: hypothetical protein R6V75_04335 [Bacteroidales bacterium]
MSKIRDDKFLGALLMLLCLSLSVVWLMVERVGTIKEREGIAEQRIDLLSRALSQARSGRGWEIGMGGRDIPLDLAVHTEDLSLKTLSEWLGSGRRLVLFLSDRHCSTCIEQALFALKSRLPEIGAENIRVVYVSRSGSGPEWSHRRLILPGAPFGRIEPGGPAGWLEESGFPVFFLAGPTPSAASPHLYLPLEESQNEYYLDQIALLFPNSSENENH